VSGKEKNNIYRYNDMGNRMNFERGSTSDGSLEKRVVFGLLEDVESNKEVVANGSRSINEDVGCPGRIEGSRE
jgi:hypothetical protein